MSQILYKNRIPKDYFVTKGTGDSHLSNTSGAYTLALQSAGIDHFNIICCHSVIPKDAIEIEKPESLEFGSILESIVSIATGTQGQTISAGLGVGWLVSKETKERYGGIVVEHNGFATKETIKRRLLGSLSEIFLAGYHDLYTLNDLHFYTIQHEVKKKYGCAVVCLGFVNYF